MATGQVSSAYRRCRPAAQGIIIAVSSAAALSCTGRTVIDNGNSRRNRVGTALGANIVRSSFGSKSQLSKGEIVYRSRSPRPGIAGVDRSQTSLRGVGKKYPDASTKP